MQSASQVQSDSMLTTPSQLQDAGKVLAVHKGIQSVLASLPRERNLLTRSQCPNDVFLSVNLPINAHVPTKLQNKILQDEYVNFGSLLVNLAFEEKFQITFQTSQVGSSTSLALEPITKAKCVSLQLMFGCRHFMFL